MQTRFTPAQLADPDTAASERILRACVHCGFCTATCPTYVLLGDELDSPRGRIYLIRNMLESGASPSPDVVRHLDRCLSCLACMTTCPSGVHYQHLIDHARVHVERTFRRPWPERLLRALLAAILPHPRRFRLALQLAHRTRRLHRWLPGRLRAIGAMAPRELPPHVLPPSAHAGADASRLRTAAKARVALLHGCVQPVLAPDITAAAVRLLERAGAEVVHISGCCGALVHHLGREPEARVQAVRLIERLREELAGPGLDAVVSTASGCGTHVKDFDWLFRNDASTLADKAAATPPATPPATPATVSAAAAAVARLARDVTEVLSALGLPPVTVRAGLKVAYHSACSMQHGQKIDREPRALLKGAGFEVVEIAEGHLCCGSAGTYNLLQPELATRLRDRKLGHIRASRPDLVATGNIGCMTQLAAHSPVPIVHTVQLLDWATGGPKPTQLDTPARSG
jgi:glycolate oxidase iron-sulfur subunit